MNKNYSVNPDFPNPTNILLADDDIDDRYFFEAILTGLRMHTKLTTVDNGEKLMKYLFENSRKLPDVLFLDLHMPRKNGTECLSEIKESEKLRQLPVVIYSTHMHEKNEDSIYSKGAHYYIQKTDMIELAKILKSMLSLLIANNFARPPKDKFVFSGLLYVS